MKNIHLYPYVVDVGSNGRPNQAKAKNSLKPTIVKTMTSFGQYALGMRRTLLTLAVGVLLGSAAALGQAPVNLAPDASFEAATPSWFSEKSNGNYFADKEKVAGAASGQRVLVVQGWAPGAHIFSQPFDLPGNVFSATMKVRSFGPAAGASITLALFDDKGVTQIASFGSVPLDGKGEWKTIDVKGVKLAGPAKRGTLCLLMAGPQTGMRVEVDDVGLFGGTETGFVTDNADFQWFEAESMANGDAWKVGKHFAGWYSEEPSGMEMLAGSDAVKPGGALSVKHALTVRFAGKYRLWTRLLRTDPTNGASYTIGVEQGGKEVASRTIYDGDLKLGPNETWVWVPLDVTLTSGEAQVVVTRPPTSCSWISRRIDLFVLTNLLDYQPQMADFRPKCYLRFTNESQGVAPYGLMILVSHLQGPVYYVTPGMLSLGGLSGSYYVPADEERLLHPGASSPWVLISSFLTEGGNRMQLLATRGSHVSGLVQEEWKGKLEFSMGDDHQIIKTIPIQQTGPSFWLTLSHIATVDGKDILTGADYVAKGEEALKKIGTPRGKVANHLDLNVIFALSPKMDDPKLINRELAVIQGLGFNGLYTSVAEPKDAANFQTKHHLPHFGLWVNVPNPSSIPPDEKALGAIFKGQATQYASALDRIHRIKLCDEPGGPSYALLTSTPAYKTEFVDYLKSLGLQPSQLKVATWQDVTLVGPDQKEMKPELFYYSGLFRLWTFADFWRKVVAIKKKYLPDQIKTYVNYSPPYGDQLSWDQRGTDPFLIQRDGGLEMGWSEDWAGYGASPEQMSNTYALLRSAGSPTAEPLGGYMIPVSSDILSRLKYYTLIANGVRYVNVYNYGPNYVSVDSWSDEEQVYPVISAVQHELGVIDEALDGTQRRKTDVAIVYNRTSGIWAAQTSATEQDSNFIQWALSHAGYNADYLSEEDITAGKLNNYKVLYLNGIQILPEAAQKIADWVKKGGVLYGGAGAGTRDEFDRPQGILNQVFGVQAGELKLQNDAGRPKYEIRTLPPIDTVQTVAGSKCPFAKFDRLCLQETLTPLPGTETILKTVPGNMPAGFEHAYGQGIGIRFAALPGIAYLHEATESPQYDIETYLPNNYDSQLKDLIAWPAHLAGIRPIAESNAFPAEITRYDGAAGAGKSNRAVVFVVNYTSKPKADFEMILPHAAQFKKAYTAQGAEVKTAALSDGRLRISFPLNLADAVVLEVGN